MKEIKCITIQPNGAFTEPLKHTINYSNYMDLYAILECEVFDVITLNFDGVGLDVYIDDEGKFKQNNHYSILLLNSNGDIVDIVAGNALIVRHNENGEIESLTDSDIKKVMSCYDESIAMLKGLI